MKTVKDSIDNLYGRLLRWNNPYFDFGVPRSDYARSDGQIQFHKLKFSGDEDAVQPVVKGYPYALKIAEAGGIFSYREREVLLDLEGVRFRINSAEELFILFEVFLMHSYRFCCSRNSVFIDIGMNAAISTLFYARDAKVQEVVSFELFKPTYDLGVHNLGLNPALSKKVKAFSYGLSNRDFNAKLEYSISRKGRMGLNGLPGDETFRDVTVEPVEVKDVSSVFKTILEESSGLDVIVKIDCEGEEYNLVDKLEKDGMLVSVTVMMLEWHYKRPVSIEERLLKAGFYVFSNVFSDLVSGMIYASRRHE